MMFKVGDELVYINPTSVYAKGIFIAVDFSNPGTYKYPYPPDCFWAVRVQDNRKMIVQGREMRLATKLEKALK